MQFRCRAQLAEALGEDNRGFCQKYFGRPVDDPETLLKYYIRHGGAKDFAARFDEAMAPANRWYCSEFYQREISDPEILWHYYLNHEQIRAGCELCLV